MEAFASLPYQLAHSGSACQAAQKHFVATILARAKFYFYVPLGWKNLFAEQGITLFSRGIWHNYLSCSAAINSFKLLKKNICHICIIIFQGI
jgi:hypothetical protein